MKIRSLTLHNFRSFRGPTTIDFRDPLSGEARLVTALAGTNGAGKTTVLEAIEALLAYALNPSEPPDLVKEAWETGLICLEVSLDTGELRGELPPARGESIHIAVGLTSLRPSGFQQKWPLLIGRFVVRSSPGRDYVRVDLAERLKKSIYAMLRGDRPLVGGLLIFPSTRRLTATAAGPIEAPPESRRWIERIEDQPDWSGGLEQLWVWQNYLDLEQERLDGGHLRDSVRPVEPVLGPGRRMSIRRGRVYVSQADPELSPVRLEQLPSGEKQVVLITGELARRARMGLVGLIDEPEISLHPTLQHALVSHLRTYARASAGQFILATHSLEVVKALPGATLFLDRLEDGEAARPVVGDEVAA